ncbi:hypothetical protein Taro_050656 [Colocasia esculenta]|uniref:Uncharacterized protein n=1 Tax=Colocasia esculenta TaxID=4460 RepID=A0A843XEL1_COLES|nr:hypothetical protein [Colocasia esculenta]
MARCVSSAALLIILLAVPLLLQCTLVNHDLVFMFPSGRFKLLAMESQRTALQEEKALSAQNVECAPACDFRCSATSHKKPCLFFCNMCCNKCLCVPSGTWGHKEECPCYNNWKTQEGGPKCP